MSFSYLASPYSHAKESMRQERYEIARYVTAKLMKDGKTIYSPIVHNHPLATAHDLPKTWAFWERMDLPFIDNCKELLVLTLYGWTTSVGMKAEIEHAQGLGKPISLLNQDGVPLSSNLMMALEDEYPWLQS